MKTIPVSNGKAYAVVSDQDYNLVARFNWFLTGNGYAFRWLPRNGSKTKHSIMMHRFILRAQSDQEIDHINKNKLDNTRENIRFASRGQNQQNVIRHNGSSQFKGVRKYYRKWTARITVEKHEINLGSFDSEQLAAIAYNDAARKFYGNKCFVNATGAVV